MHCEKIVKKEQIIAGVDEAGRGCLAGPVVAGAVILPSIFPKALLRDSKILTEKVREQAYAWIIEHCDYGIGMCSAVEVDTMGIKKATHVAMQKAVHMLTKTPEVLWIDGRDNFVFDIVSKDFVKGDARFACIAAASIVAKVTRDAIMKEYDKKFPTYGFVRHKGYGTKQHREAIKRYGVCDIHRRSYEPIKTWEKKKRKDCSQ